MSHAAAPATPVAPPPSKKSWKIIVLTTLSVVAMFVATLIWWNNRAVNYDLTHLQFGKSITFTIRQGNAIRLYFPPYDFCPLKSSGELKSIDSKGTVRTICGSQIVDRNPIPFETGTGIVTILFRNKQDHPITLTVSRLAVK